MIAHCRVFALAGAGAAVAFFSGCASEAVRNPAGVSVARMNPDGAALAPVAGIEAQDLATVTDRMARGIVGIPEIARAKIAPHVVLEPVMNNTPFPIDEDVFLTRIRVMLNSKAMNKVRFLDRAMMARFREEQQTRISAELTTAAVPAAMPVAAARTGELRGADYFLAGQLDGMTARTAAGGDERILCRFRLTDAGTGATVWADSCELKKAGLGDAAHR
jgi:PBP1b-binding outer membrane lipoprotein LpoB